MGSGSPLNNSRGYSLSLKKKIPCGHAEESSVKRRDCHWLLTQVLQSSAKLPVLVFLILVVSQSTQVSKG